MNFKHKIILYLFLCIGIIGMHGCGDFFDINEDPNNPTSGQSAQLLTNSQVAVAGAVGLSTGGLSSHLSVFTHQTTRRAALDRYATQGNDFMITSAWQQFYDIALQDLEVLIDQSTASDDLIYVGIAQLLKAFSYSMMVDVWGDIPYSEAIQFPEIRFPVFDNDEEIYPQLIDLIDLAIVNLENPDAANTSTPGIDDLIYGGNTANWVKFANTLKLKMFNQVRETGVISDVTGKIQALIADDNLISSAAQDFQLMYGSSTNPENRYPGFVTAYTQGNPIYYISIWFHQILSGQNPDIFNGVVDPRIPYYYSNQLLPGEAAQNPPEYIEADGFLSIHFGSSHPNQAGNQDVSQSVIGIYPCGGWYDDGSGTTIGASTGTGVAPERMLTNYARLFIEAELALDGVITKDPRELLIAAMEASFDKVNEVVLGTGTSQSVPTLERDTAYFDSVLQAYDDGDADRKKEIIITQKWIASFGFNVDAYSDYRRTGYPIIFDANNDTGQFAPFTSSNPFMVSLPWRSEDLNLNPNSPPQKNVFDDRVFWDVD